MHAAALLGLFSGEQVVIGASVECEQRCVFLSAVLDEANRLRDWVASEEKALQVGTELASRRFSGLPPCHLPP